MQYILYQKVSVATVEHFKKRLRSKKNSFYGYWLLLILAAMIAVSLLSIQIQDANCKSRLFSFVQIGDTQWANETQLQSIVDFIIGNKTEFDIQYVVQMGDIVEVYSNETDWEIKNSAFSQLTEIVPFGWLAGNHDGESREYIGDNYYVFNVSNYPNMTSSYDQGRNTAQFFNFSDTEILFVNIEYFANETALQWFENLYQQYDKATVIFSTHSYIDLFGNYTEDTINSTYLDAFPRVKLALCGHLVYAYNQEVNGRTEILFNYQRVPGYVPDFSDFIRLYTVFDDGTVDALTYSELRNQYLTDSANKFSFSLFTPTPTPTPTSTPSPQPSPTPTPSPAPSPTPAAPTPIPIVTPIPNFTPNPTTSPELTPTPPPTEPEQPTTILAIILGISAIALIVGALFYRKKLNLKHK